MRTRLAVLAAGLAAATLAGPAKAQPFGYYPGRDASYAYRYEPPRTYGYDGRYTAYSYGDGYDGFNTDGYSAAALVGAELLGAAMAPQVLAHAPYDQYGADPNGMIAPDGHRIKCKLTSRYDGYHGQYVTRRACW